MFASSGTRKEPQTLEERQAAWDNEHTGINAEYNIEQYKYGRPARSSKKLDQFNKDCTKSNKANGSNTTT